MNIEDLIHQLLTGANPESLIEADAPFRKQLRKWNESGTDRDLIKVLSAYRRAGNHTPPEEIWSAYRTLYEKWLASNASRTQLNRDASKVESALARLDINIDGSASSGHLLWQAYTSDAPGNRALQYVHGDSLTGRHKLWIWGHKGFKLYKPSMRLLDALPPGSSRDPGSQRHNGLLGFLTLSYTPDGINWWRLLDFWKHGNEAKLSAPHYKEAYRAVKAAFRGYREGHPTES